MSSVVETRKAPPVRASAPTTKPVKEEVPADQNIPDNYVQWVLKNQKELPPITWQTLLSEIKWLDFSILTITPAIALWGIFNVNLRWETAVWSVIYYFITGLGKRLNLILLPKDLTLTAVIGITAGYHRLWAHRSYNASKPLEYALAMAGVGAVQGSIKWWSRGHRAHHRYTDTPLDPYDAQKGFFWSHMGWMLVKPRRKPGVADVSDLSKSEVVRWQHRWYLQLILFMGFILPTVVAGLGWGDWKGGFFYAATARLVFVHHVSA